MSTTLPTYNGWPNYPTWDVYSWLTNEEGTYYALTERIRSAISDNTETDYAEVAGSDEFEEVETLDRDGAVDDLAESLETWCAEMLPDVEGFPADLLGWALRLVDWRHMADNLIEG